MPHYYRLSLSKIQLRLLWLLHLSTIVIVAIYLESPWLKWSCMAGMLLSALHEHKRLIELDQLRLGILPAPGRIELCEGDEPHFFSKYKVYETRWFAILNLIDRQTNRTLILNSDSFDTVESYRRCRLQLRQLVGRHAA